MLWNLNFPVLSLLFQELNDSLAVFFIYTIDSFPIECVQQLDLDSSFRFIVRKAPRTQIIDEFTAVNTEDVAAVMAGDRQTISQIFHTIITGFEGGPKALWKHEELKKPKKEKEKLPFSARVIWSERGHLILSTEIKLECWKSYILRKKNRLKAIIE